MEIHGGDLQFGEDTTMALIVNTNIASLVAQRNLSNSTNALGDTFNRLSSGLRINTSADDSAGLSISDRMEASIRGLNQAVRNSNDTISVLQIAEGALTETTNALQRIRELAVQSANDTNTAQDRTDIQQEVIQLVSEINRIAETTQFNNQHLIQGSYEAGKIFQVGANMDQTIVVSIQNMHGSVLGVDSGAVVTDQSTANAAILAMDNAIDSVTSMRANLGAYQNRFEAVITNISNMSLNTAQAKSRILDADIAAETAELTQNNILQQAGTAVLAQANQQPAIVLQLLR